MHGIVNDEEQDMNAYMGKILRVDLNTGALQDEALDEAFARAFVGGSGLAARYIFDQVDKDTDPLGPQNPLVFMTGPLVGTAMPSASRFSVCAISPLTRIWGEANSGGFFGHMLRAAGYDGLIITGKAASPAWLSIVDGRATLHSAAQLWGLDSYQTQVQVRQALGLPKARVACIGQAGENLVKMAAVMNDDGRAAGRTGMGAVMGAKNLKAIAVHGSAKVPLADPDGFTRAVRAILGISKEDFANQALRLAGTAGYVDMGMMFGDLPVRYYQQTEWDEGENLSGVTMSTQYLNRNLACYRCPIGCVRETRSPRFGVEKVDGPEYETLGALGSSTMVSDLEAVIYMGHLCNQYGIDTISAGVTIALACELFERGLLTSAETGGLEIRYGDGAVVIQLLEMMAMREGFGDLLAEGSATLAEHFGVPELAVTVNRLEAPMHDPRAFAGMAVTYALSPRGACHMEGDMYGVDTGQGAPVELGIIPGDRFDDSEEKGRIAARNQAWRNLYNSLTLCQFQNPGVMPLLEALNQATGWNWEAEELLAAGKRIVNLKRLLNSKLGLTRANDRLPELMMKPIQEGGTEGFVPNLERMLAGAYAEYDWDPHSAMPSEQVLRGLGLVSGK
jgi:aldehyde:ferredoxin oxidoreductase